MKCQRKICPADATAAVCIRVPILGMPIAEHNPMKLLMSFCLCDIHMKEADPRYFFATDHRLIEAAMHTAAGKFQPDFSRAYIEPIAFDSPDWALYQQLNLQKQCTPPNLPHDPSQN